MHLTQDETECSELCPVNVSGLGEETTNSVLLQWKLMEQPAFPDLGVLVPTLLTATSAN